MSGNVLTETAPAVLVDKPGEYAQGLLNRLGDWGPLEVLAAWEPPCGGRSMACRTAPCANRKRQGSGR
jgi:hypothetical protein